MQQISTALKSPTVAVYTLPPNLGKKFVGLSAAEISSRFVELWSESICFLNELAPHGYIVRHISSEVVGEKVKVKLHLMVTPADHRRIKAEWDCPKSDRKGEKL